MDPPLLSILASLVLIIVIQNSAAALDSKGNLENNSNKIVIGAIMDNNSRIGKEEMVAMKIALEDFNKHGNQSLILQPGNSEGQALQAAFSAQDLVSLQAKAIIGPRTWEATALVAEVGSKNQVPVLSFADSIPEWATDRWPFLLQASANKDGQMKAIAAIVQSFEWRQVTLIHDDVDSSASGIIPSLSDALQEVGAEISHVLSLPPYASSSLHKELEKIKGGQCRVFVVHLSFPVAVKFFERAKKMKMMEKDYVWIITDALTSLAHSFNSSIITSMQGVVGVKGHFRDDDRQRYQNFFRKFRRIFSLTYPEEDNHEPGDFALQAYDAMQTVALAVSKNNKTAQDLLETVELTDFDGLIGNVKFANKRLPPLRTFQIINVFGRSYKDLGFWSDGLNFSETIGENATYFSSMKDLGNVFWPGGSLNTPRGWTESPNDKPLIIGVPTQSTFKQYVSVDFDELTNETIFRGYAIELFKATNAELPFHLPYEFHRFDGTYTELVKQIYYKKFDAAVGDIAIVASRLQYAEFTHPYTESELVMIVPLQSKASTKAWLFMRPFTKPMWVLICIINIYNGFVILLIERNHGLVLRGSILNQIGTLLCLSFTTLFSLQGAKLRSNLSRMVMVVWLFMALIITQTYTANLSSILTIQGMEPAIDSIEALQRTNSVVGHFNVTFVANYLVEVLHFNPNNLKNYTEPDEFAQDLHNRKIGAFFLEKPIAKLFLARYCNGLTVAKPSFKVGGFAFAFPRGSPLLPLVTEALVKVSESGRLQDLEKDMIAEQKCEAELDSEDDETFSLSPSSFSILFIFTGGTSTIALIIYIIYYKCKTDDASMHLHRTLWILMFAILKRWSHQRKPLSRRFRNNESTQGPAYDPSTSRALVSSTSTIDGVVHSQQVIEYDYHLSREPFQV